MIQNYLRQSILTKVSVIVVLTSSLTLGIVGFWEYKNTQKSMEDQLHTKATMMAERLALSFVKIVWDYDQKLAESVILSEMKEESILGIFVWEESEEKALFGGWRSRDGQVIAADAPVLTENVIESSHVISRKDMVIGKVAVFVTDHYLRESLRDAMGTILLRVLLLDVVIVILLIFFLRKFLIRPMSTLRNVMISMPEGKLDQKVEVVTSDEIGQIAESFNSMVERLNRREAQLVESEEKFSTLVSQAADAMFFHGLDGAFWDVNQRACEFLGYTRQELLKMKVSDVDVNFSTQDKIDQFSEEMHPGPPLTLESELRRKDGTTFPVEIRLGLIQIRGETAILSFARDISERKIAEKALQKAHDELEVKVVERTAELAEAKELAEAANISKSEFLARMSHEIRTPLNAVTGLTNIVLKSDLTNEQRDYLNKVQIAGGNLLEVINDILDFSKVEAGRLDLGNEPFDLDEVLEKLGDLFSNRVVQKNLELVFAVSPQVPRLLRGDAGRLNQILTNLVENAVKFTDAGEIVIGVESADMTELGEGKTSLSFRVSDTGTGISSDMLPSLFDPFIQADSSLTREHEGTGLGLAICKRLVELMGGDIWAESDPGSGSIFYFTIVLETQKEKKTRLTLPEELQGLKTLVVDDSTTSRQVLVDMLESFAFNVSSVDSGEKAVETIRQAALNEPYQLVLLDWKMPGIDGIDTARRIRFMEQESTAQEAGLFIIMVTAYGFDLMDKGVDTVHVDTWLLKPVKATLLHGTIVNLFSNKVLMVPKPVAGPETDQFHRLEDSRVLVVEDSALNRDVAVALLKEMGLTVETAENGDVAIGMVFSSTGKPFDALLMDIQMPVMDGYEATRCIREWEKTKENVTGSRTPVIAITAHALKGEKEKCLAAGMDDYLAKPIDEQDLHRVLSRWLPSRQKQEV